MDGHGVGSLPEGEATALEAYQKAKARRWKPT